MAEQGALFFRLQLDFHDHLADLTWGVRSDAGGMRSFLIPGPFGPLLPPLCGQPHLGKVLKSAGVKNQVNGVFYYRTQVSFYRRFYPTCGDSAEKKFRLLPLLTRNYIMSQQRRRWCSLLQNR